MGNNYDNAFRTMEMDCPRLLIPVVNEVFHQEYPMDAKVRMYPNEQMITTPEDEQTIRFTDSNFMVIGESQKRYHIECESNPKNGELLIRMFQYDMQIALDGSRVRDNKLHVRLPRSAVLYLRHTKNTPDQLQMVIEGDEERMIRYIPVVKVQRYSLEEIFEKRLWFFLPFHVFVHERELSVYNEDEKKRSVLINEYQDIVNRLDELSESGEIEELEKHCIITSMRGVLDLIAEGHKKVIEEAKKVMGGEVLEYEAKTIYRNGKADGRREGVESVAINLLRRGESEEQVSKDTGLDLNAVQQLLQTITI